MSDGMGCECAARSGSECCCAGVDWRSGREVFLEERIKELEEKADKYDFLLENYGRCCSVQMNGVGLWALRGISGRGKTLDEAISNLMDFKDEEKEALGACPKCGGEADNGFDRCLPPNPYHCTKCAPTFRENGP